MNIEILKSRIIEVPDFPKPGVNFKDITPLVHDADCYRFIISELATWAKPKKPTLIIGIESRGYLFAAPLAYELSLGLSIIRKKGKLPRKTVCIVAPNEYAVETFEIHADAVQPGDRVIIVDDLIATGSSSISAISLVKKLEAEVVGFAAVVELVFLDGLNRIKKAYPEVDIFTLLKLNQ
ncbi:MAG: adenine phosphoribosyltransferase [Candidatus Aminicenantes bacterium]|nr:adenine phosphoribosyltransferase [Candidatus Aminicenantes bacterium]